LKAREAKRLAKIEKKEKAKEVMEAVDVSLKHQNESIVRNVNYTIMKSKGLTRKRKKIDRNPRVKHREKYRKALQKRKSRVQDYQEGPKGKYAGESSGFKAGIIRSTALN
jgi:U3 small nucleolar RNA-associated protein 3